MASVLAPPVTLVPSGAFPVTQTPNCTPFVVSTSPNVGWPVTVIDTGGFPMTLLNDDGSVWSSGPPAAPVNTVLPVISGTSTVGQTISTTNGTWTASPSPTYTYQWKRAGGNISGATASTYTLVPADTAALITVTVTATNASGNASATSASFGTINLTPNNAVAPAISGSVTVGSVLTSTTGTWAGTPVPTYAYQWKRDTTNVGTNASTYTLVTADIAAMMTCTVTGTNTAGSASASSNALGPVTAAAVGGGAALLTAETDGWATDFLHATDAQRVAKKTGGSVVESGLSFFTNSGTSSKWVFNAAGTLVNVAAGSLALDYDPVTHAALGLLVEPQATNLLVQSSALASWAGGLYRVTVSSDAIAAPDGTATADRAVETAATGTHEIDATPTGAAGTYTFSTFAKAGGRDWFYMDIYDSGDFKNYFNVTTGVVGNAAAGCALAIQSVGNGWYRCSVTRTMAGALSYFIVGLATANGTDSYLGDITKGMYFWGAQIESGTVATSYIPTLAATVTRAGDLISVTSASIGYSATAGSWWAETSLNAYLSGGRIVAYSSPVKTPLYTNSATSIGLYDGATVSRAVTSIVGINKFAMAFASGDRAITGNGLTPTTDAAGGIAFGTPGATIYFGDDNMGSPSVGYIRKLRYLPRRPSNAELQAMTT